MPRSHRACRALAATLGAAGVAFAVPVSASAAITSAYTGNVPGSDSAAICVNADSTSPVTFALHNPDGQLIEQTTASSPTGSGGCDGTAGSNAFVPTFETIKNRYPFGGVVTAQQGGANVSFPLPIAATSVNGDGSVTLRLKNLPTGAQVQVESQTLTATDGTLVVPGLTSAPAQVSIAGAVNGLPVSAGIAPVAFTINVGRSNNPTDLVVDGLDPSGAPALATLRGPDGRVIEQVHVRPRISQDEVAEAALQTQPLPGSTVTVSQDGWFGRTVTSGQAQIGSGGFAVALPALAGETGSYAYQLRFVDPNGAAAQTPALACTNLGSAVDCAGGASRTSVTATGLPVATFDQVALEADNPAGDAFTVYAVRSGAWGTLDDGHIGIVGAASNARGTLRLSNPGGYRESILAATDATGATTPGAFHVHVRNHALVRFAGSAFGMLQPYAYNLTDSLVGSTLSGVTYPNAPILAVHDQGATSTSVYSTADGAGRFSINLSDLRVGDLIGLSALDPQTGNQTSTSTAVGVDTPQIGPFKDRAYVRGVIHLFASGVTTGTATWQGDFGSLVDNQAPFTNTVNTRQVPDGIYRIQVLAAMPSMIDYRYLIVDNTRPRIIAARVIHTKLGRPVIIAAVATDNLSGIANVTALPGDNSRTLKAVTTKAGRAAFRHSYLKAGVYRVTMIARDRSGNLRRITIRVVVTH